MAGAVFTGTLNYLYSLALIRLLPPPEFAKVSSLNSLLLIIGTVAAATIPWVVAREVSNSAARSVRRRRAVSFALVASVSGGLLAAAVIAVLQLRYTNPILLTLSGAACLAIFVTSVAAGYLQGEQRFAKLVTFRLLEVVSKVATGLGLAFVTHSAAAGIAGFAVAAAVCALYGLWLVRAELTRPSRHAALNRGLWRHAAGIGSVQGAVALVQTMDIIMLGLTVGNTAAVAGYQAMQVIGRVPVFLSIAVSIAVFPRLSVEAPGRRALDLFRQPLRTYLLVAGALTAAVGTLPQAVARIIFPESYDSYHGLLLPVALAGFAAGLLNLIANYFQATSRYRTALLLLAGSGLPMAMLLWPVTASIERTAWVTAAYLTAVTASLFFLAYRRGHMAAAPWSAAAPLAGYAAAFACSSVAAPWVWLAAVPLCSALLLWQIKRGASEGHRYRRSSGMNADRTVLQSVVSLATREKPNRRRRVLLLGNYGNGNTGDESILAGLLSLVPDRRGITVISRNPEQLQRLHQVTAKRTTSAAALKAFLVADSVCIGGGGMFGRGLPPLVRLLPWVALAARLTGKQIYFLSLGAYRNTPRSTKLPLQLAARCATAVTVRDPQSAATLSTGLARGVTAEIVPDPSLFVPAAEAQAVHDVLAPLLGDAASRPPIVINVKAMPDREVLDRVLDALADGLARWRTTTGDPIVFLAMSETGDYGLGTATADHRLAQLVIDRAGLAGDAVILGPGLTPSIAKGVCAQAAGVMAMRLHAQIFASTTGTPLLGITFEPKSRLWLAETDADQRAAETLTGDTVLGWLQTLRARV